MDNPGDAKYGMTPEQILEAYKILKSKGAKEFGLHAFLASNTVTNDYYPMLAKVLFEQAVKLSKEAGVHIKFINLSGGIGFRINRIKNRTIYMRSEREFGKCMKKFLFRQEWEMLLFIQS